jgi:hypothetical protein
MLRGTSLLGLTLATALSQCAAMPAHATIVARDGFENPVAYTAGEGDGAWNSNIGGWGWTDFKPGTKGVWAPGHTTTD